MKNKTNSALRKAKAEYYKGLILENKNKPDQLWKAIKMIMPSNSKADQTTKLQDEEGTYEDAPEVASCFNRFFSTIGSTLASSFIGQPLPQNNPYSDHDSIFSFNDITVDFTMKQLSQLNTKKSNGLDGVNGRLLQDAAPAVAGPLTAIMNASLCSGIIPNEWKLAKVTAIHKDGPQTDPSNYRPISVLSLCMKIFERAVYNQLDGYLKE